MCLPASKFCTLTDMISIPAGALCLSAGTFCTLIEKIFIPMHPIFIPATCSKLFIPAGTHIFYCGKEF